MLIILPNCSMSMATPTISHNFQSLAAQAQAVHNRRDSERLFYEALEDARAKASSENDTRLIRKLASIDDRALIENTVKHELQSRVGRSVIKFSESLKGAADIALMLSESNAIAKPVVGIVCYIMTILQQLPNMQDLIEAFKEQMETYFNSFNEHFLNKHKLGPSLEGSIKLVHRVVINFGLLVIPLGKKSTFKLYMSLMTNDTKSELVKLVQDLEKQASFVYNNALGEMYHQQQAAFNVLSAPQPLNTSASTPGAVSAKSPSIPVAQTPHFTGRQAQLGAIRQRLGGFIAHSPSAVALWGMGGVGKTQTALRYWSQSVHDASKYPTYRHILFLHASDQQVLYAEVRRIVLGLGVVNEAALQRLGDKVIVESLLNWLRDAENWLLIFDNVQDINHIHPFRPGEGKGHILFTTRDKYLAELLCSRAMAMPLNPLTGTEGMELVRSIMGTALPQTTENDDSAQQVSDFALGLPLLIEQVAMFALSEGRSLLQSLERMRNKRTLLKARAIGSFHEHGLTAAAILITSFDSTQAKFPMAGALFQYLCFFEPSSIPMSLLTQGTKKMDRHLARDTTFVRGAIRTPEAEAAYQHRSLRQGFNLYDYDPWDLGWLRRILHIREFKKEYSHPNLPRVDTGRDIEMQTHWQNDILLKGVLDDPHQLNKALTQLEAAALVRLQPSRSTIWIHDVFAEAMKAYVADESEEQSIVKAHVAATLVWLAFPLPNERYKTRELCNQYLPHAESCVRHLKEIGGTVLMDDTTIGAELSHVIASAVFLSSQIHYDPDNPMNDTRVALLKKSVNYYKESLRGYTAAQKRLMAHPQMQGDKGRDRLITSIHMDMSFEEYCQVQGRDRKFYVPQRWFSECETFGNNAVWRAIQTAGRIGAVYWDLRDYDEAELWVRRAKAGIEWIWGPLIECIEVEEITKQLFSLKMQMEDWEGALIVAEELKTRYEALPDMGEGSVATISGFYPATELSCMMGRIYHKLGKWEDAKTWFLVGLRGYRWIHGSNGAGMWPILHELADACAAVGDWDGCLKWWLEAVQTLHGGRNDRFWENQVVLAFEGVKGAKARLEENKELEEALRKEIEQAQKVLEMYKIMVEHSRKIVEVGGEDLYSDEMTEETRKWLKVGEERGVTGLI